MVLEKKVYDRTRAFPAEERSGLTSQLRRAAVSVPSNIAEGQARRGAKEFVQFLSLASGSLAEMETQLLLAADLGYLKSLDGAALASDLTEIRKMLSAIQRKMVNAVASDSSRAGFFESVVQFCGGWGTFGEWPAYRTAFAVAS